MSRAIPSSYSEYLFDWTSRDSRPSMICDGGIMPLRNGTGVNAQECLRGEDIFFLYEAIGAVRYPLLGNSGPVSGIINRVQKYNLTEMQRMCGEMKNYWGTSYPMGNMYAWSQNGYRPNAEEIKQKILDWIPNKGVDFSASDTYTALKKSEIINLFKNVKQYSYTVDSPSSRGGDLYFTKDTEYDQYSEDILRGRPTRTNTYHTSGWYLNNNSGNWHYDNQGLWSAYTTEGKNFDTTITWTGSASGKGPSGSVHWQHEAFEVHPVFFLRFYNYASTGNNDDYYYDYSKEYYAVMDIVTNWVDLAPQTPLNFTTPDNIASVFDRVGSLVGEPLYANLDDVPITPVPDSDGYYWISKQTSCEIYDIFLVAHPLYTNLDNINIA